MTTTTEGTETSKWWLKSKTMIFNIGLFLLAVLPELIALFTTGGFGGFIGDEYRWLIAVAAVVNIVLRSVTKESVTFKG